MRKIILKALKEKKIFIGYYMLCRYLNGKGYIRYGCNAGYKKPFTNGKNRLNPCKILCKESKIYHSKIYYWCKKLEKENKLFLCKMLFYDFKNPNSKTKSHKLDLFVIIAKSKEIFIKWISQFNIKFSIYQDKKI